MVCSTCDGYQLVDSDGDGVIDAACPDCRSNVQRCPVHGRTMVACELAQRAWHGYDAPGEITEEGISAALARTFHGNVTLLDVNEWASPAMRSLLDAGDTFTFQARLAAAVTAGMILGAKLQETNCT